MPTRRLAAIMFSDIVGYTAMMQENEVDGLEKVKRYTRVVDELVPKYEGEVVQFLGDGSLCLFQSAIKAIEAAKEIQFQMQQAPNIPLRIGIHIGDIAIEDQSVYGNGVNLASRLESIGVPGSILLSERVTEDIRSHPNFEMAALGKFRFKNVEEPIRVYALADSGLVVPDPRDMKGKGERVNEESKHRRSPLLWAIGALALILGFSLIFRSFFSSSHLLDSEVRKEKLAISIFENQTGLAEYEGLGAYGSEWISNQFREAGINTVSPEIVRAYQDQIQVLASQDKKSSFQALTGAQYVITGSFFLEGDSLEFLSRLINTSNGEQIKSFPSIKFAKHDKESAIRELTAYMLGYWVSRSQYTNISTPKYEAYLAYRKGAGKKGGMEQRYMVKALEIDPNFVLPHIQRMLWGIWGARDSVYKSHERKVQSLFDQLTRYEKQQFAYVDGLYDKKYSAAINALRDAYEKNPENIYNLHELAFMLLCANNEPRKAINLYTQYFSDKKLTDAPNLHHILEHYPDAYLRLGRPDSALHILLQVNPNLSFGNYHQNLIRILASMGNWEALTDEMTRMHHDATIKDRSKGRIFSAAMEVYALFHSTEPDNPYAERARYWLEKTNSSMGEWYYITGAYEQADSLCRAYWEANKRKNPVFPGTRSHWKEVMEMRSLNGRNAARMGQKEEALKHINDLEQDRLKLSGVMRSPSQRGKHYYEQAKIYAILRNKEKAMERLQAAIGEGKLFRQGNFHFDYDLVPLLGDYEPFRRLIEPKN